MKRIVFILFLSVFVISCESENESTEIQADFEVDKRSIKIGKTSLFSNTFSETPDEFEWFFEGGTPSTSKAETPQVTYSEKGSFGVEMKVKKGEAFFSIKKPEFINVTEENIGVIVEEDLKVDFVADKLIAAPGEPIVFSDLSEGIINSKLWSFEGALIPSSTEDSPIISYENPGKYSVSLTITSGDTNVTETKTEYIEIIRGFQQSNIPLDYVLRIDFDGNSEDQSTNSAIVQANNIVYVNNRRGQNTSAGFFAPSTASSVLVENSSVISLNQEVSISLWFFNSAQLNDSFFTLVEKTNPDNGGHARYGMWTHSNGLIQFCIEPEMCPQNQTVCQQCIDSSGAINLNTWVHIVGAFDGQTLKLYINGQENASVNITPTRISQTPNELYFGTDPYDANPSFLSGRIDDFRLYNRALTPEEISELFRE